MEPDSLFSSPEGCVLVGREHWGDATGPTRYAYAQPVVHWKQLPVQVLDARWSEWFSESEKITYTVPEGCVLVGREHKGDENGSTRYQYARLEFRGEACLVIPDKHSVGPDNYGRMTAPPNRALIGRNHYGDDNGPTWYYCAQIVVPSDVEEGV